MSRIIYLLLLIQLGFQGVVKSQTMVQQGFENSTCSGTDQYKPFFDDCVEGWISTHGTPSIHNMWNGVLPYEGAFFVTMYASHRGISCPNHLYGTEGIALNYNFEKGRTYRLTYAVQDYSNVSPPMIFERAWVLTNGLTNRGPSNSCHDGALPETPPNSRTLETIAINEDNWTINEHIFTVEECEDYSQLWLRARLFDPTYSQQASAVYYLDAFKLEVIENPSNQSSIGITVNDENVTDLLEYTLSCDEEIRSLTLNTNNLLNPSFISFDPGVWQDPIGTFNFDPAVTSFSIWVLGTELCGNFYYEEVTINIEQDCCEENYISVVFDCPVAAQTTAGTDTSCDPCDYGIVVMKVVDQDNNPLIEYESIHLTDKITGVTTELDIGWYVVDVETPYTLTVVIASEQGKECTYTYDFIYECCKSILPPSELKLDGSVLSWTAVPGAESYIVESVPSSAASFCNCKYPTSISEIETTGTSVSLPPIGIEKCYLIQVRAVCTTAISEPSTAFCVMSRGLSGDNIFEKAFVTPNPVRGFMTFKVQTNQKTKVNIGVYDFYGAQVKSFTIESLPSRINSISWYGHLLESGIYFVTYKSRNEIRYDKIFVQ